MRLRYDSEADAAYIYLKEGDVKSVDTQGDWPFHVDLDKEGDVIGIEVMDASTILSKEYLFKDKPRNPKNIYSRINPGIRRTLSN